MRSILAYILLLLPIVAFPQEPVDTCALDSTNAVPFVHFQGEQYLYNRHLVSYPRLPFVLDERRLSEKHFWRAAAETFGMNMGLWAFDRYIQKGHFAYISWSTIRENFRHGFEWDNDHLVTNMFAHPYNGSVFYNAGRSNGYNFWQSELFAVAGSAMWEMFMEREYPSTNDIIATPVGGAALGEVFYRTSDVILDDRATGGERFGRELAAFIVNPMRGSTRIVTGDAWRHRPTTGRRFGLPPVSVDIALGGRYISMRDDDQGSRAGGSLAINIEYGDRFAPHTHRPYDYFSFLMELNFMRTQPLLNRVEITGRLLSTDLVDKDKFKASLGLYQHFDFFDSDTIQRKHEPSLGIWPCEVPYKLGIPASVGGGVMARYVSDRKTTIDGYLHANGVVLAGILTDFYRDYHRNYNWGSGFGLKMGLNASFFKNRFAVSLADQFYRIYTWNGYDPNYDWSTTPEGKPVNVQGDNSDAWFNHLEFSARLRIWERLSLTAGIDFYHRTTNYDDIEVSFPGVTVWSPMVESNQLGVHIMLSYSL